MMHSKHIGAPNSVARYLAEHSLGLGNKFAVLERIDGELMLVSAHPALDEARTFMLPGRELVDIENCLILHEAEQHAGRRVRAFCHDLDGAMKAELYTVRELNPITVSEFGPETWCLWEASDPKFIRRFIDEDKAREAFRLAMIHGTNGIGA